MAQNYKDLQDQAKELGLPYVGVSRKDLEASIAHAKESSTTPPGEATHPTTPVVPSDPNEDAKPGDPAVHPTTPALPGENEADKPGLPPVHQTEPVENPENDETPPAEGPVNDIPEEELSPREKKVAEKKAQKEEANLAKKREEARLEGEEKLKEQQKEERVEAERKAKEEEEARAKALEVPEDANTAIVMDGINKVRTYSLELHGENFADLAKSFVESRPKMTVVFLNQPPVALCPNCGAEVKCPNCGSDIHLTS